jgi:predicted nucleotidyltransferase
VELTLLSTLDEITKFLTEQKIAHCLIGGLAVGARAASRATSDVDLMIDCEVEAAVDLLSPLKRAGFEPFFDEVEKVIRQSLLLPVEFTATRVTVDMAVAVGGLDFQIIARSEETQLADRLVPVATSEDLILMKLMAGRAQDQIDVKSIVHLNHKRLDWDYCCRTAAQIEEALAIDLVDAVNQLRNS